MWLMIFFIEAHPFEIILHDWILQVPKIDQTVVVLAQNENWQENDKQFLGLPVQILRSSVNDEKHHETKISQGV